MKELLIAASVALLSGCVSVNKAPDQPVIKADYIKQMEPECREYENLNRAFHFCIGPEGIAMAFVEGGKVEEFVNIPPSDLDGYSSDHIGDAVGELGVQWLSGAKEESF